MQMDSQLFEIVEYCQLFEIAKWRTIQSAFGPSQGGCQQKSWEFWTVHNKDVNKDFCTATNLDTFPFSKIFDLFYAKKLL